MDDLRRCLESGFSLLKSLSEYREEIDEAAFQAMTDRCEEADRKLAHDHKVLQEIRNNANVDAEKYFYERMAELERNDPNKPIERYEELRHSDTSILIQRVQKDRNDPYTKQQIVKPFRNRRCGHVYDKAGMDAMLAQSKNTGQPCPCPVMGCPNQRVSRKDMQPYSQFFSELDEAYSVD
ncbi:hypothetical protein Tcan_17523 [Toxocara canis]|uniref:E3 SUMO-protein ligase NSE2 n=1 Tax=Toxocara canis TaxID=6265 RepID=A0A0B2V3N6_TOXCA|nr:hypothetical protein Tcan_17523 [Toxocara canis]